VFKKRGSCTVVLVFGVEVFHGDVLIRNSKGTCWCAVCFAAAGVVVLCGAGAGLDGRRGGVGRQLRG
jgi:hypothetical protein